MASPGIANFPREILKAIWCDEAIALREVCELSRVCKRFSDFGKGRGAGDLWKIKLGQRFRSLSAQAPRSTPSRRAAVSPLPGVVSFEEYRTRCIVATDVGAFLAQLADEFVPNSHDTQEDAEALRDLCAYATATATTTEYAVAALLDILATGNSTRRNLQQKTYAKMALRRVRAAAVAPAVGAYRALPPASQSLEAAAVHVAQYFQPFIVVTTGTVSAQLDGIARQVRTALPEGHPAKAQLHPDGASLSDADAEAVLSALNTVLFTDLGFQGNAEDYYSVRNSMINVVLERRLGIPITLSVVYAAVAGRLGVTCVAVNFPGHFLLKWERRRRSNNSTDGGDSADSSDADREVYIDAFHGGAQKSRDECLAMVRIPTHDAFAFRTAPGGRVMERMVRNLVGIGKQMSARGDMEFLKHALALSVLASDTGFEERLLLARIYLHHETNLREVKEILQPLLSELSLVSELNLASQMQQMIDHAETLRTLQTKAAASKKEKNPEDMPKLRSDSENSKVLYATGQVMYHRRYHYRCVISGWDPVCRASPAWIQQMGVDRLPAGPKQPFYNVLVADGSTRYAAQGSLRPADVPAPTPHPDVGRHFTAFRGTCYIPTENLHTAYPEDAAQLASEAAGEGDVAMGGTEEDACSDEHWDTGLPPLEASDAD